TTRARACMGGSSRPAAGRRKGSRKGTEAVSHSRAVTSSNGVTSHPAVEDGGLISDRTLASLVALSGAVGTTIILIETCRRLADARARLDARRSRYLSRFPHRVDRRDPQYS